jgi:hypothetical protein
MIHHSFLLNELMMPKKARIKHHVEAHFENLVKGECFHLTQPPKYRTGFSLFSSSPFSRKIELFHRGEVL